MLFTYGSDEFLLESLQKAIRDETKNRLDTGGFADNELAEWLIDNHRDALIQALAWFIRGAVQAVEVEREYAEKREREERELEAKRAEYNRERVKAEAAWPKIWRRPVTKDWIHGGPLPSNVDQR